MYKSYFITAIRNLLKHRYYLAINIIGMSIGLAGFLIIARYVWHETHFDTFNQKADRIYRVCIKGQMAGQVIDQAITAAPMAKAMISEYPEIEAVTRITRYGAWLVRYNDKRFNEDGILFADSTFFNVFDFKLLQGNPKKALSEPRSIILTEDAAKKYFGSENPVGKRLNIEEDTVFYEVTGVMANIPSNSHVHFDMLASLHTIRQSDNNIWVSHNFHTYIVLKNNANADSVEKKLQHLIIKYIGPQLKQILGVTLEDFAKSGNSFSYYLQPLRNIHLKSNIQEELEPNGNITYVYSFSIIALLLLAMAIINFINLSTAKAMTRAREVGIRKVSGSTRLDLIIQFLGESFLVVLVSVLLSMILVEIFSSYFFELLGYKISIAISNYMHYLGFLLSLSLIVGLFSGLYPAFVLSSFKPISVLKGRLSSNPKSGYFRNILVVIQFTASVIIIIGTIFVYQQLKYLQNKNLGFEKEQLLVVRRNDALGKRIESFRTEVLKNSNILNVAYSSSIPGKPNYSNNAFFKENDPLKVMYLIYQNQVSFDYPQTLGISLLDGRFFNKEYPTDSFAVIINQTAAKMLGFDNPVGEKFSMPDGRGKEMKLPIIGVVRDYNFKTLHHAIEPLILTIMGQNQEGYMTIRIKGGSINETISFIEQIWGQYTSKQPFQYFFFNEYYNQLYDTETKTGKLLIIFTLLGLLVASLGLLGLIAFSVTIRTKEIGIRKTFGASTMTIIRLLTKEVTILVLISSVIAWPLAYFAIENWLNHFANHVDLKIWPFAVATMFSILIAWSVICVQAIKAAYSNPIDSLRYE